MLPTLTLTALVAASWVADGAGPPAFEVKNGTCEASGDCVTSTNFNVIGYPNLDHCIIELVLEPKEDMTLVPEIFFTERDRDFLFVNGNAYSGEGYGLAGVTPVGDITWSADESRFQHGWKICAKRPPSKVGDVFEVTEGECTAIQNCVQSTNFGWTAVHRYPNNDHCLITVLKDGLQIKVQRFEIARGGDQLIVNEKTYDGDSWPDSLDGVNPSGQIEWTSDSKHTDAGWQLCADEPKPKWDTIYAVNTFPDEFAHEMSASNISECKRYAEENDMKCFVTYSGTAYFKQKTQGDCHGNLRGVAGHTLYTYGTQYLHHVPKPAKGEYVVRTSGTCQVPILDRGECDLAATELQGQAVKSETLKEEDGPLHAAGCLLPMKSRPLYWNDLQAGPEDEKKECSDTMRCLCIHSKASVGRYNFLGWVILAGTLVCVLASLLRHKMWMDYARWKAEKSNTMTKIDALNGKLVRNFVPSVGVTPYEFKGMMKYDHGISLDFTDLGLTLKDGRKVLDGVTGSFPSGNIIAIMGPSGCGKTTCMNVLCGKATYGTMVGEVKINGKVEDVAAFKNVMGFVPQEDTVYDKLTVREQITYSAELRNDHKASKNRIDLIVQDVLQVLQVGHIQDSIVGSVEERGISGGQRKRVNVGLELAATPCLLFLDEPTSGLDSTSSLTIINSLKKMTELNMTIIMVIHQPRYSLFALFDQVLLLGKGGRTVYQGSASQARAYFESLHFRMPENENAADWLLDIIEGQAENAEKVFTAQDLFDAWEARAGDRGQDGNPRTFTTSQDLTRFHDLSVTRAHVDDQWEIFDVNKDHNLDAEEFRLLLDHSTGGQTSQPLAADLFELVSGGNDYIKKQDLVDYIARLVGMPGALQEEPGDQGTKDQEALLAGEPETASLERVRPWVFRQYRVVVHRCAVQFWRNWKRRLIDTGIIAGTAVITGQISLGDAEQPENVLYYQLAVALLTTVSCISIFSDRAIMWRESSTGISLWALFTGRGVVNFFDIAIQIVVYTGVFYAYTFKSQKHPVPLMEYLIPTSFLVWTTTSWGYLLSLLIPPGSAVVAGTATMMILCGVLPQPHTVRSALKDGDSLMQGVLAFSPVRWSGFMIHACYEELGTFEHLNSSPHDRLAATYLRSLNEAYRSPLYGIGGDYYSAAAVLLVYGIVLRCLALMVLRLVHKKV